MVEDNYRELFQGRLIVFLDYILEYILASCAAHFGLIPRGALLLAACGWGRIMLDDAYLADDC